MISQLGVILGSCLEFPGTEGVLEAASEEGCPAGGSLGLCWPLMGRLSASSGGWHGR